MLAARRSIQLKFRELWPVQLEAIDAILDGNNRVVLAPTVGGKTEAAFFPLLTRIESDDLRPVSVIYSLRSGALLNTCATRNVYKTC
jgi:ATP-dependent helicase Lhr and Lhr-like helicase